MKQSTYYCNYNEKNVIRRTLKTWMIRDREGTQAEMLAISGLNTHPRGLLVYLLFLASLTIPAWNPDKQKRSNNPPMW